MRHPARRLAATTAVCLLLAACGGEDEPEVAVSDPPTREATQEETEPSPTATEDEPDDPATTVEEPQDPSTTAEEPAEALGTTAEEAPPEPTEAEPPPEPTTAAPVEPPPPALGDVPGLLLGGEPQELEELCRVGEVVVANYVFEASVEFTPFEGSAVGIRAFTDGGDLVAYGTQTDTDDAVVLEGSFAGAAFPDVTLLLDPATPLPDCPFAYEPTPVPPQGG